MNFINYFMNFDLIPVQASTYAEKVDQLFYFLVAISLIATIGVFIALIVLSVKFRRDPENPRESEHLHNPLLELTWTIIPLFIFLGVFAWGAKLYADYKNAPEAALRIDIIGKQWMWKVQHANGVREVNNLHIPVGTPVELNMTSQDVLHDYYIPAFRVKQDVIPGRFTKLWFEATREGSFHVFCAEYCGTEHSLMGGTVTVMSQKDYVEWLAGGPKKTPVEAGEFLFQQRGCVTCHSGLPGARGPDLKGVFGSTQTMTDGESVVADEDYLFESILYSNKRVVEGYTPLMPSFANQLSVEDVTNLIAYIKSLGGTETADTATETTTDAAPATLN
jgi:cytochrome c oxidase subunit 2